MVFGKAVMKVVSRQEEKWAMVPRMRPGGYPRPGYPIAPATLREVLAVPTPAHLVGRRAGPLLRLCDLDGKAWLRFPQEICRELARAVVERVETRVSPSAGVIWHRRLPRPPQGLAIEALELDARTHNRLAEMGFRERPQALGDRTIGQMLGERGFGARCLVDLLVGLEAHAPHATSRVKPMAGPRAGLLWEAARLRRLPCAETIRRDDPRLGYLFPLIGLPGKTLRDVAERLLIRPEQLPNLRGVLEALRQLRAFITRFSRKPLEEELLDLLAVAGGKRQAEVAAHHFGWDGSGGGTLQRTGERFGLTREGVRQLVARALARLAGSRPFAPALDRAVAFVSAQTPAPAAALAARLAATKIAEGPFRPEGLLHAARSLGRAPSWTIITMGGRPFVVSREKADLPRLIRRTARRLVENLGATTLLTVARKISRAARHPLSTQAVRGVLEGEPDFAWLDARRGWFWLRGVPRNPLRRLLRKSLSVVGQLGTGALQAGISRASMAKRRPVPPRGVVMELCRQLPGFRVTRHTVVADPPIDWRSLLHRNEQVVVQILREHGPILPYRRFLRLCVDAGIRPGTAWAYLLRLPFLARYGRELCGLAGTRVPVGLTRSLLSGRPAGGLLRDNGWTPEGHLWLGYRVSPYVSARGRLHLPLKVMRFLRGDFLLTTPDGRPIGKVVRWEGRVSGLRRILNRPEAEKSDHLVIVLDPAARKGRVWVGDIHLLENFRRRSRWSLGQPPP